MVDKYLELNTGRTKEKTPATSSAGAGDGGRIVALDTAGRLDASMMPIGVGETAVTAPASENLSAGNLVNFWLDVATLKVRKADATTNGKRAHGFVEAAVTSGNDATVYLFGVNNNVSDLTLGADYYLDTTAGGITDTAPSASGNLVQRVGTAQSATALVFQPQEIATVA